MTPDALARTFNLCATRLRRCNDNSRCVPRAELCWGGVDWECAFRDTCFSLVSRFLLFCLSPFLPAFVSRGCHGLFFFRTPRWT